VKLVRESLFEKFSEEGDAIHDMGIGLLPKYEKELDAKYRWSVSPEPKDHMRVEAIADKAKGDTSKENRLAQTMCKLITDPQKAYRRYIAAKKHGGMHWEVTRIFLQRAGELHEKSQKFNRL